MCHLLSSWRKSWSEESPGIVDGRARSSDCRLKPRKRGDQIIYVPCQGSSASSAVFPNLLSIFMPISEVDLRQPYLAMVPSSNRIHGLCLVWTTVGCPGTISQSNSIFALVRSELSPVVCPFQDPSNGLPRKSASSRSVMSWNTPPPRVGRPWITQLQTLRAARLGQYVFF